MPENAVSWPPDLPLVIERVDRAIERFLVDKALPGNLHRAMVYSVLGGGKRLRPALAWYSSVACGGSGEDALHAAVGVELVHAFSLVHDDLPALDNDDLRRGRATLHRHAGEAMAILAGDALLSLAYEAVLAHGDPRVGARLGAELGGGTRSMIVGQVYDTLGGLGEGLGDEERIRRIHEHKTGALLTAACRMGAISGGADDRQLALVTEYANAIGLQFQIIDDLLDVEGASERVGKALGKDQGAGKLTYPGVLGVARSREIVLALAARAQEALGRLSACTRGSAEPLRMLGQMLTHRTW